MNGFSDIRQMAIRYGKKRNLPAFNVISKLNWFRYEMQIEKLKKLIPEKSKVLDMGCGWGFTTAMIKKLRPDLDITGSDIEKFDTWEEYKKCGCKYVVCDAENMTFDDNSFDAVISFGMMEHLKDDNKFIREVHRVLKDNGINFIFNLPNKYSLNEFFAKILGIWYHKKRYDIESIKNLLKRNDAHDAKIGREFFIPAQVDRASQFLGLIFNKNYRTIDLIDKSIQKTPLNFFSEAFFLFYQKGSYIER